MLGCLFFKKWAKFHELGLIKFCLPFLAIFDDFLQYPVLKRKWRQTVGYYPPKNALKGREARHSFGARLPTRLVAIVLDSTRTLSLDRTPKGNFNGLARAYNRVAAAAA